MTLNKEQKQVIGRPADATTKVLAGAGTGKTRVLVERYLRFVFEDGIAPDNLLALTFTKKAAAEMHGRVFKEVVRRDSREVLRDLYGAWIMNFHQFAFRVIKENSALFGIDPDVEVASEVDIVRTKRGVQRRFEAGTIDGVPNNYEDDMPAPNKMGRYFDRCISVVDKARGNLWTPDSLRATIRSEDVAAYGRYLDTIIAVWRAYEEDLHARLLLDFPDMIRIVVEAFSRNDKLRDQYARRFKHVLVDEFQDTSEAQNELLRLLTGDHFPSVTVVGDEKQSIYRWRDARIDNLREFAGQELYLTKNYRSTQTILDLAYHVLVEDPYFEARKNEVHLAADRDASAAPVCLFHPPDGAESSAAAEARALGAWILAMTGRSPAVAALGFYTDNSPRLEYGDVAILVRSLKPASGLPHYEEELKRLQIPYAIVGGVSRLDEKVLELLKSLLRLLVYPGDVRAFLGVVEAMPFELSDHTIHELFHEGARRFDVNETLSGRSLSHLSDPSAREFLGSLRDGLEDLSYKRSTLDLAAFVTAAMEYTQFFYHLFAEGADLRIVDSISKRILELVEQLIQRNEANLAAFLEAVQTLLDKKQFGEQDAPYVPEGRVVIMTQHQAKGLEFSAVAVPGIKNMDGKRGGWHLVKKDGLYSSEMKDWGRGTKDCEAAEVSKVEKKQEERCLLYVAITRARDHLFLSTPFPNGIDRHKKDNLFATALRAVHENEIPHSEWRETPVLDKTDAQVSAPADDTEAALSLLVEEWSEGYERLEESRTLTKPMPQGLQFVSWRALHTFAQCPLQYYYQYVSGIQNDLLGGHDETIVGEGAEDIVIEKTPKGMSAADFGAFVHRFLYEWLKAGDTEDDSTRSLLECVADRHYLKATTRAEAMTITFGLATRFRESVTWATTDVLHLEWPVQRRVGRLVFHGVVDRVDRGQGLRIVDYKVGRPRNEYSYQVQFYAWIVGHLLKEADVEGAVAYLHGEVHTAAVDLSKETQEMLGAQAEQLGEAVDNGTYHATPGVVCQSCGFRKICPEVVS